jgi:hypothetical protein
MMVELLELEVRGGEQPTDLPQARECLGRAEPLNDRTFPKRDVETSCQMRQNCHYDCKTERP